MSVRFFVTSAGLLIFSWLATTYLRAVPMDTYPARPVAATASASPAEVSAPAAIVAPDPDPAPIQFISTATQ